MNAAEMIQAAIDRLTELRGGASNGPWTVDPYDSPRYATMRSGTGGEFVHGSVTTDDAKLIAALHRTIDAQLAFLRHSLTPEKFHGWDTFSNDACMLAEAILGGAK